MHLSPIKGAFPHKDQHDRTCPVALGEKDILERGSVICVNKDGAFELAASAQFPLYLALMGPNDMQAQMAGYFGFGAGPIPAEAVDAKGVFGKAPAAGLPGPRITGIHMDDGDVWETDMFDADTITKTTEIGVALTVKDGLITTEGADETNTVGYLVKPVYSRYVNDADVPGTKGIIQGYEKDVIQFQCGR